MLSGWRVGSLNGELGTGAPVATSRTARKGWAGDAGVAGFALGSSMLVNWPATKSLSPTSRVASTIWERPVAGSGRVPQLGLAAEEKVSGAVPLGGAWVVGVVPPGPVDVPPAPPLAPAGRGTAARPTIGRLRLGTPPRLVASPKARISPVVDASQ